MKPHNFWRKEDGSITLETVIMVPLLVWAYLAMFTIFDNYRQYTTQQKAAYTVSDLVSRQVTPLNGDFLDGMHDLFEDLSRSQQETSVRLTIARYNLDDDAYEVVWSRTRGSSSPLETADISGWVDRLPILPDQEQIIIFETSAEFTPVFDIGLRDQTVENFVFTRPRYASQVCFELVCG